MTDSGIRWRKKGPSRELVFRRRALWIRDGAAGCRRVGLLGYPDVEVIIHDCGDICTLLFLATPWAGGRAGDRRSGQGGGQRTGIRGQRSGEQRAEGDCMCRWEWNPGKHWDTGTQVVAGKEKETSLERSRAFWPGFGAGWVFAPTLSSDAESRCPPSIQFHGRMIQNHDGGAVPKQPDGWGLAGWVAGRGRAAKGRAYQWKSGRSQPMGIGRPSSRYRGSTRL